MKEGRSVHLSEKSAIKLDNIGAVATSHDYIQVHQQLLLFLLIHSRADPLKTNQMSRRKITAPPAIHLVQSTASTNIGYDSTLNIHLYVDTLLPFYKLSLIQLQSQTSTFTLQETTVVTHVRQNSGCLQYLYGHDLVAGYVDHLVDGAVGTSADLTQVLQVLSSEVPVLLWGDL